MEQDSKFQANSSQDDNMQANVSQMSNSQENNSQGKVPFISKLAYGMGDVGCNFSWMFVGNFLMIFYTDVFGISMSAVATLMLVSRFWDAINDPIIGTLTDKTHTRWGRFRPWLLFGAPITALVLILTFWAHPEWSQTAKIIYMAVTYCILVLGYTCVNLPYGTLCGAMTQDIDERAKLNTSRSVSAMMAIGVINIVTTFYMTFINDAQAILRKQGYKVMIAISNENPEQERENILMMEQLRVDGILMSACDKEHNVDLYNKVIERGIPIVFFDRTVEKVKASQVHMDDYIMSFFMVEALLRKGYKHIIHIPGPAYIRNSYERLRGYRDALEKFHIEYQAQDVLSPALSAEEGSWVMERFLEKNVPFDAVFGFTETAVLGAKSAIQKRGLRIPEDVALCCMSGTALATLVHPLLTVVEQPIEKMAQESCRLLLEHIADGYRRIEEIALRGETVIREST